MTTDSIHWVLSAAIDSESLIFWWVTPSGIQCVLMPDATFRWLDDYAATLFGDTEGPRGWGSAGSRSH